MKKLALLLLALAIVIPAFADDAKVMPAGVLRTYVTMAYNSFDEAYDADGELQDAAYGGVTALNFGGALEFGVTEQITAAIQWAPGYTVSSEFADPINLGAGPSDKGNVNGINDVFIGAKAQILGPNGFVPNDTMRFAAALGLMIPLADPDFEESVQDYLAGDDFLVNASSKEALGYGFRLYYDYIINDMIFLNLYNETIFYAPVEKDTLATAGTDQEYKYGYDATFEFEPHFEYPLNETVNLSAGLPLTYTMSPEVEVEGTEVADSDSSLLKLTPSVSAFLMTALPVEFKVGYGFPLMGKNDNASKTFIAQIKLYAKFY